MSHRRIKRRIKDIRYTGKGCLYVLFSPFILFYYLCKWFFLLLKNGVLFFWNIIKLLFVPFKWITGAAKKNQSGASITMINDVNAEKTHLPVESQEQFLQMYDPPVNTPNQTKGDISMISLIKLQCPNCSANLEVDPKLSQCFCQYCGTKLLLNDENKKTIHIVDEAEITRAETEHMLLKSQLEFNADLAREELEKKKAHDMSRKAITCAIWTIIFSFGIVTAAMEPSVGGIFGVVIAILQIAFTWISFIMLNSQTATSEKKAIGYILRIASYGLIIVFIGVVAP